MACLFKLALPSSHTSVGKMSMKISLASSWFHLWSGKITIIWRSLRRYHDGLLFSVPFSSLSSSVSPKKPGRIIDMHSNRWLNVSDSAPLLPQLMQMESTVWITDLKGVFSLSFYFAKDSLADLTTWIFRKKSKTASSSGKVRPILPVFVHKEMLQRHDSMSSFSNMSIGDVSGALVNNGPLSPSDPEKKLDYYPDLSYGALSSNGGTKVDNNSLRLSSFPSSADSLNSSASSITYPTPVRTRQDSGIEISSVHRDSLYVETTTTNPSPSESSRPQPTTNHSAVWWQWWLWWKFLTTKYENI